MNEDTTQSMIASRFDQVINAIQQVDTRVQSLESGFQALDEKVEQRLHDTRPIWEAVQTRLDEMQTRLDEMKARLDEINIRLDGIETRLKSVESEVAQLRADTSTGFRAVDRKIGILSKNMIDMTADIRELQDRIEKIESPPS
jgi:predicted  nucleic acid-binding Zn-ribbon protein